jgi:hypothetical protein
VYHIKRQEHNKNEVRDKSESCVLFMFQSNTTQLLYWYRCLFLLRFCLHSCCDRWTNRCVGLRGIWTKGSNWNLLIIYCTPIFIDVIQTCMASYFLVHLLVRSDNNKRTEEYVVFMALGRTVQFNFALSWLNGVSMDAKPWSKGGNYSRTEQE